MGRYPGETWGELPRSEKSSWGGVRLEKIRNLAECASHGRRGAEDGPTSLKFRSRLESLKLARIPTMTTSTTAKKFACLPFRKHRWPHSPTYSHVSRWHARLHFSPHSEAVQPASLPARLRNGANPRQTSVRIANLRRLGFEIFPARWQSSCDGACTEMPFMTRFRVKYPSICHIL